MDLFRYILIAVASYLLGSLSVSILLSRTALGGDVREKGSGNAGATNMARVYGLGVGFVTLGCDMLKALAATWLGSALLGDLGLALGGICCMLGHCFPVFHKFKGGKGISVGAALGLAIDWKVFVFIILVFLIVAFLSKKVSLGSICAAVSITVASILFAVGTPKLVLAIVAMVLAIFQHRGNIKRLIAGTEPDFHAASMSKK
ncbi:MAG: glycerol-3-phosphate 1-O-acyltransferase PlsY [Oscillospiraceae bacterium]|nr:glycerol-3-phosphate 1-O-acyltransferase PlsY [Oscillospiraceae bacterium]